MKKIILLTALMITAGLAKAQVSAYIFSQSSGTYTSITGGTQLIDGSSDMNNKISSALTIPAFIFNNVTYTTAYVTSNGILTLGATAPASNAVNGISSGTGSGICICPFSGNLDRVSNDGNAEVRYQQIGSELVFQWKSVRRKTLNESFDFQARLNTGNGAIKFVYNLNSGPANNSSFPEVGIRTSSTDYNNRRVGTGAENWATSLAGTANTNTMRFTSGSNAKSFVDGQTYTWTPAGQCSGTPAGGTAAATTSSGACPAGSNLSLSGNSSGISISYQWQSSPDGTTWTNISGATSNAYSAASVMTTTQYRCNVTCFNSSITSASVPVTVTRTGPAAPTFITNPTVCSGSLPATLSVTAVSGCTVDWYNASSGPSLLQSGSATYAANAGGTYYAQSRNTTSGCLSTSRTGVTLTVDPMVTPAVTVSTPQSSYCQNDLAVYTASPVNGGASPVYQWKVNGASVGGNTVTYSYRPVNGDIIKCVLLSNAACASLTTATSNSLAATLVMPSSLGLSNGDMVWTGSSGNDWTNVSNWLVYGGGSTFTVPAVKPTASDNVFIRNNGTCFSTVPDVPGTQVCRNLTISAGNSLTMIGTASLDIYGNWTNLGTFTAGSSSINFKGTQLQQIASGGSQFYNVSFNNTAANPYSINITEPMTINGTATFTNGVAYFSGSGSLLFTDNATSNGGGTNSFIAGKVTKTGNDPFIFPVGKMSPSNIPVWAPLRITAPLSTSDVFSCEYSFTASYNNLDPLSMCDYSQLKYTSGTEYWDLSRISGTSAPDVTLYWKDANRSGIVTPSDLVVAHLEVCGGSPKWVAMSSSLNGISGLTGSITGTGFTSFSPITFGSKSGVNPLPVELLSLTATCNKGDVLIEWSTATELNNDRFEIESSADAANWQTAGSVKGAGNSDQKRDYSMVITDPQPGVSYYRLKQIDYDGKFEYFGPVNAACDGGAAEATVSYYPNPFTDNVTLEANGLAAGNASVVIYDMLGNKVAKWVIGNDEMKDSKFLLNTGDLPGGIYFVEFTSPDFSGTTKLVKK